MLLGENVAQRRLYKTSLMSEVIRVVDLDLTVGAVSGTSAIGQLSLNEHR